MRENIDEYEKIQSSKSLIPKLIESLVINTEQRPELLINYHNKKLERVIGRSHIITGPAGVGKTSLVYHSLRKQQMTKIVSIDCNFEPTPDNIVSEIVSQLSKYLYFSEEQKLQKSTVMDEQLNFNQLDKFLDKSHYFFVFMIKHAEKLVLTKRQVILYNFLDWIKDWGTQGKIGLILISRQLDFIDKLEKRVKSRFSSTSQVLFPPASSQPPKQMICARFQSVEKGEKKAVKDAIYKIKAAIKDNKELNNKIEQAQNRRSQRPPFYLQVFKLILCCQFKGWTAAQINNATQQQLRQKMVNGFDRSFDHLPSLIDKSIINLQNSNYPQYLVMAIIRSIIRNNKPKLTFKQILKEYRQMKVNTKSSEGSFNFPDKIIENAVQKLIKSRIICISRERQYDFQNADIWSTLSPDTIFKALNNQPHLPEQIKQILNM